MATGLGRQVSECRLRVELSRRVRCYAERGTFRELGQVRRISNVP